MESLQYRPKNILFYRDKWHEGVIESCLVKAGVGICQPGQVMALQTSTSKFVKYNDAGSDGANVAVGILARYTDASGSVDKNSTIHYGGEFIEANLTGLDAAAKTDLGAVSRPNGCLSVLGNRGATGATGATGPTGP